MNTNTNILLPQHNYNNLQMPNTCTMYMDIHSFMYLLLYCVKQHIENIQYQTILYKKQECLLYTPTWRVDSLVYNFDKFTINYVINNS